MSNVDIELDFHRDLAKIFRTRLLDAGYVVPPELTDRDVVYAWSNVRDRIPHVRPRRVHRSREFRHAEKHAAGITLLESKFVKGETVHSHLSRKLRTLDYHDKLLSDWGVQHLHLGTTYQADGLICGTSDLLYCIIEPDDVYFIQVMNHQSFSEPQLLEIVNANWPQLLVPVPLFSGAQPTPNIIKSHRQANVQSLFTLADGTVLAPRGGGYATSGHSLKAMMSANNWSWITEQWETIARNSVDALIEAARQRDLPIPSTIKFILWENENVWHAIVPALEAGVVLPLQEAQAS